MQAQKGSHLGLYGSPVPESPAITEVAGLTIRPIFEPFTGFSAEHIDNPY
jgi:hypothetical protein